MKTLGIVTLLFFTLLLIPASAPAETWESNGHVVHTHALPVIVHRVLPPYTGIHVWAGPRRGRR